MVRGTVVETQQGGQEGYIETDDVVERVYYRMEDVGGPPLEAGMEVEFQVSVTADGRPKAVNLLRL